MQQAARGGALHSERREVFGNVGNLHVEAESILLEPAETRIGGGPAIVVFGEAGDGAVVDDFAFGIAPAAVDDLIDGDFIDVAGDDAIYELGGVATGDAIFKERRNVDERSGIADGIVFVLVVHFVNADGVVAGPFAIVKALAECEGSFVEGSSDWHVVSEFLRLLWWRCVVTRAAVLKLMLHRHPYA